MKRLTSLLAATALTAAATVPAMAEKWDMPMAYSASNFHSATGAEFAKCVTTGTGGRDRDCHAPIRFAVQGCRHQTRDPDRAGPDW